MDINIKEYLSKEEIKDIITNELSKEVERYFKNFNGTELFKKLVVNTYVNTLLDKYDIKQDVLDEYIKNKIMTTIDEIPYYYIYSHNLNNSYSTDVPQRPTKLFMEFERISGLMTDDIENKIKEVYNSDKISWNELFENVMIDIIEKKFGDKNE